MESSFAGVDWASEKHDVVVQNAAGEELLAASFARDEAGLRSLCRQLVRLSVRLVAIERPDGVLVERLLDAGLRVLALHPNQVAATRARFRASGGKSDRFDVFVLCELARTDHHRFRVLEPGSDQTKALRALTRAREDLVQTRVALTNQLRAEPDRFWPGAVKIFRSIDSPIALAFLEKYPSPVEARTLGEQRLAAFLARRHYSGGKTPAELLRKLRSAPEGRAGELEIHTRRQLVLALVALLGPLVTQIKQLERQIAQALEEHPDGELFRPLFRDRKSVITAAELVAEIGDCRAGACCTPADSTRHWHPWAADHYARAIARGHDHPRAIRGLGRAWCRVLWRCWQDRTRYDPARHRALQQHRTVTIPTPSEPRPDTAATQRMLGDAVTRRAAPEGRAQRA